MADNEAGLFSARSAIPGSGPLADRMRPQTLDDIIGQDHIVGQGRLLRRAIQIDRLSSLIFYGPPGTGKTSLARVIANTTKGCFESLNAVLSGIKDIREAIDRSDERQRLYGRRTILFVDEVHRWNKAQQDALLPWVENGTVILVGATTENPFFEVNRALVSRSRIFQLKSLKPEDLMKSAERAIADRERGYGKWQVSFEEGALEHLVETAGGDARSLLNALELAVETSRWTIPPNTDFAENPAAAHDAGGGIARDKDSTAWPPPPGAMIFISMEAAEESIQRRAVLYDRDGDYHFDTISAFIKSVRGSDPDAALYWLAKMVRAGEDPSFIFRRMIILASEDVGLADPAAVQVVIACAQAFERIGFPEGNFPLAQACLYLATAPKSNSAMAFFDALKEVEKEDAEVPNHLRDASRDAEGFGHGEGYIYPHAYRDHWAAQQYLPTSLRGRSFYSPGGTGYEGGIRESVNQKRELQAAIILGEETLPADGEFLTWSAAAKGREGWFKRLESNRGAVLLADRDALFNAVSPSRHSRILIPMANDGLLLWESLRRSPEGLCAAVVGSDQAREALLRYAAASLDEAEMPEIAVLKESEILPEKSPFSIPAFDRVIIREPFRRGFAKNTAPKDAFAAFAARLARLLEPGDAGRFAILASPPAWGQRVSPFPQGLPHGLPEAFREAEAAFFSSGNERVWEAVDLREALEKAGFDIEESIIEEKEERLISSRDIDAWFDGKKSSWGAFMLEKLGGKNIPLIKNSLLDKAQKGPLPWQWQSILIKGKYQ